MTLGTTQARMKEASAERADVMTTMQSVLPVQAPDQPANADPADACAVNLTIVPFA